MKHRTILTVCITSLVASFVFAEVGHGSAGAQDSAIGRQLSSGAGQSRTTFNFARSIAADASGRVHAVWHTTQDGRSQVYYRRPSDDGKTWEKAQRLSEENGSHEHPSIAVSGDDVFVVWHCLRSASAPSIYLRRSGDGRGAWDAASTVCNGG